MSTRLLSDKNSPNYQAIPVSRKRAYSDFDGMMRTHPIRNDLVAVTDIDAVKQSVRNLVMTNHYEIPFAPFQGGNTTSILFEPVSRFTLVDIQDAIKSTLQKYEPRVDQVAVTATDDPDLNSYNVTVSFRVIAVNRTVEVNFNLERLR